jgi:hypothetical protein
VKWRSPIDETSHVGHERPHLMVQGKNMECADIQQINANDANEETPVPLCPGLGPTNGGVDKHQAKEQRRTPEQSVGHDFDFRGSQLIQITS